MVAYEPYRAPIKQTPRAIKLAYGWAKRLS